MKGTIGRLSEILFGKQRTIKGYKFVSEGLSSCENLRSCEVDRPQWTPGVALTYNGKVRPYDGGFHASSDLRSAFDNNLGDRLFEVEARGVVYGDGGLFAAKEMKLTREIDLKPLSVEYAIGCAKRVLPNFEKKYPNDDRPRKAIEAAEKWLKEPTEENMLSAKYAGFVAFSAAWSAAGSTWSAGYAADSAVAAADSADRSAHWSAKSAAWSAAHAASSAADSAMEEKWQTNLLEELVKKHYL